MNQNTIHLIEKSPSTYIVREYLIGKGLTFTKSELLKKSEQYLDRYIENIRQGMPITNARELALDSL